MNSLVIVIIIAFVAILPLAYFLGAKAYLTILMGIVVMILFFLMLFVAYWYLFKRENT
jgi:hypothetical protein